MQNILDVTAGVAFDDSIARYQEHIITPQTGTSLGHLNDIQMEMGNLDAYTFPHKSYIYIVGNFLAEPAKAGDPPMTPVRSTISNNGFLYLFEEVRLELNNVEIEHTRNVGVTTTMKSHVSLSSTGEENMFIAGWNPRGNSANCVDSNGKFGVCIPLSSLLGFAEDHRKILVHAKLKLTLRRSNSDQNCYETAGAAETCHITIQHISWRLPFVTPGDKERLELLRLVERKKSLTIPFRCWDLAEYPVLPTTDRHVWSIQSFTQLEKPRFVIVGFQTDRRNNAKKSATEFDHCSLTDLKVYIENECYPFENLNVDFDNQQYFILYRMYAMFRESYYGKTGCPALTFDEYKDKAPLIVIDCSRQNDKIKRGTVNLRIEFKTGKNVPAKTTAYALIIHDRLIEYNVFDDTVNKL